MTERHPESESELIDFVRAIDEVAPPSLHARIGAMVAEAPAPSRRTPFRRRGRLASPLAAAVALAAAAVIALAVVLGGSGGGGGNRTTVESQASTFRQAAVLTLTAARRNAPGESPRARGELDASVDGVAFPYWEGAFGWRSVGARSDVVGGRRVMTVFYADRAGRRIGYAIVGGTPPIELSGGIVANRGGTPYRIYQIGGVTTVAWLRSGRLCVVAGRDIDAATLLRLASWNERRAVAT